MNEMQVFKSERYKDMPIEKQLQYIGTIALMLGVAMDWADDDYPNTAFEIAGEALDMAVAVECDLLYGLVDAVKCAAVSKGMKDEAYYNYLFDKYAQKIIANCVVIRKKCTTQNRPDSWVRVNGEEIPVEIKLNSFDKKALRQLERYMFAFGANKGIAVGDNLSVKLPRNIEFIPLSDLDRFENNEENDKEEAIMQREEFLKIMKSCAKD